MTQRYLAAAAAIDAANADDPTAVLVRGSSHPLAQIHGVLADEWVVRLVGLGAEFDGTGADVELVRLAARAHHLRRWEVPRSSAPEGRAGYLKWRKDQKARHAELVAAMLATCAYDIGEIARVQSLIRREGLGRGDVGTQAVEDAACLVFVETQLADVARRLTPQHLGEVIRKTARKMSAAGVALLDEVPLDDEARGILNEALVQS